MRWQSTGIKFQGLSVTGLLGVKDYNFISLFLLFSIYLVVNNIKM
jgi:hypothetical protein